MNQIIDRADAVRIRLYVLPTALVAWADGRLDMSERKLLEEIATKSLPAARAPTSMAHTRWLDAIPTQEEVETWVRLVKMFLPRLSPDQRSAFVLSTQKNLWRMARVSGYPQAVSTNERAVITRIESILRSAA